MHQSLTVLAYGGGQDSWKILCDYVYDASFRERYAPGRFVVVMADTGNEHPETYRHVDYTRQFCERHGVEFHFLNGPCGFHSKTWISLQSFFGNGPKPRIMSNAYKKTCTDNLKIQPIYRWLDQWIEKTYGFPAGRGKTAIRALAAAHGRIRVLIGFAKGEEKRIAKSKKAPRTAWMRDCIRFEYPLVDLGIDRAGAQAGVLQYGEPVPPPSNCIMCPFKSDVELLWTARNLPEEWQLWVNYERSKLDHYAAEGIDPRKNFGVGGTTKTLSERLAKAEIEYADWTDAMIADYRMSHGHCVASAY